MIDLQEELVNPTSSARLRINIGPGLTKNINMQIPMAAIHLDSFGRDIEAKEGKHGPGASYSASMMTNQGLIYIDVVFWSPSDIRQYLTLDTTYIVYDGKLKYSECGGRFELCILSLELTLIINNTCRFFTALAKGDDTQWPATFNVGSNSVVMEGDPENFTGIFAEGASRDVDTYNTNLTATYKNVVVVQTTLGESTRAGGDIYNVDLIEQDSGKVKSTIYNNSLIYIFRNVCCSGRDLRPRQVSRRQAQHVVAEDSGQLHATGTRWRSVHHACAGIRFGRGSSPYGLDREGVPRGDPL